jgi:hypothetical protein
MTVRPDIRIAVVGCGQLGSRHLQSLVKLPHPIWIDVVEPSATNRRQAHNRMMAVLPRNHNIQIEWHEDQSTLNALPDLTIVATNSKGRAALLSALLDKGHKRFLIEKMVCQSKDEFEHLLEVFEARSAKGWVDCTRRYFPFYQRIIPLVENEEKLFFNATGGNHGLGSNAIHLLDLYWRMIRLSKDLRLNGDYLSPCLLPNPRGPDFTEFAGTIIATTTRGGFASISFHPENNAPVLINITSDNYRIFINEAGEKALLACQKNDWLWEEHEFQVLHSSNLTGHLAWSILEDDSCNLPTLQDSFLLHDELFRIFTAHFSRITGKIEPLCPIT